MACHGGFLLVCLVFLFQFKTSAAWKVAALTPPPGFSMSISATIKAGKQMYSCDCGAWVKSGSSAALFGIDPMGSSKLTRIGNFESTYDQTTKRSIMEWTLFNSPGDRAESGDNVSSVTGVSIHSQNFSAEAIKEVMFEITSHKGAGAAARISYVVMTNTKGGLAPHSSLCTENDINISVPFDAVFDFYVQDTQPPTRVPEQLKPAASRVVQGFFMKGKMHYVFDGRSWLVEGVLATLYNVAGGDVIGKFGTIKKPDQFGSNLRFVINDPNGFYLTGKLTAKPVKVTENGAPWQLVQITSSGGTPSPVGPFTYVQIISTRGGLEPAITGGAKTGLVWKVPFTAMSWFLSEA